MKLLLSSLFWLVAALLSVAVFVSVSGIAIFLFPFDRKRRLAHAQGFWWADIIIGINPFWELRLSGLERVNPRETYVIVANHQSLADIALLYKTHLQFKWVAKDSLFNIPVFGWCMSLMKYIKLARGEYASIRDSYEEAGYWLRQGVSVLFFPEGTRSPSGQIGDFKNGAFKLAIKEKRPILPIRIEGSRNIIPPGSWIFKARTSCRVSVLPEIDSRTFPPQDFALLREKTHQALSAAAD